MVQLLRQLTADGKYFVFQSRSNVWALREKPASSATLPPAVSIDHRPHGCILAPSKPGRQAPVYGGLSGP